MKTLLKLHFPHYKIYILFFPLFFFCSCISEFDRNKESVLPGNGINQRHVLLKLHKPAASRAISETDEQEINDLYILSFKKAGTDGDASTLLYHTKAEKVTGDSDGSMWKAQLLSESYVQDFVVIANAESTNGDLAATIGKLEKGTSKEDVLSSLTIALSDEEKTNGWNSNSDGHSPFTMYGEKNSIEITPSTQLLEIGLYRMLASMQVYFGRDVKGNPGSGLDNFEPVAVYLYNFNDRGAVAYASVDNKTKAVTAPNIPAGANLVKGPLKYVMPQATPNKLEREIYLYETKQPEMGSTEEKHKKRTCLVIEGKFNGSQESSFYRVDIGSTDDNGAFTFFDIIRNNRYTLVITSVVGSGLDNIEDAFNSNSENITSEVVQWNDPEIGDVVFDGANFFGVGTTEFRVGRSGGNEIEQLVNSSANLGWTATLTDEDGNEPSWCRFENGTHTYTFDPVDSDTKTSLNFIVDPKAADGIERRALMFFQAGNLEMVATIIQDDSSPVFLKVKSGTVIDINNQDDTPTTIMIEYGPAGTNLDWTLTNNGSLGLNLSEGQGMQGSFSTQTDNGIATVTINTNELKFDNGGFGTGNAFLTLVAKGTNGMTQAVNVELRQSVYGATIVETRLPAAGQRALLHVVSNMNWEAGFEHDGTTEKYTTGLAGSYSGKPTRNPADPNSIIEFQMLQPGFSGDSHDAYVTFTDRFTGHVVKSKINMIGAWKYNGRLYEVISHDATFENALKNSEPLGLDGGWRLPTRNQAIELAKVKTDLTTWYTGEIVSSFQNVSGGGATCPGDASSIYWGYGRTFCIVMAPYEHKSFTANLRAKAFKDGKETDIVVGSATLSVRSASQFSNYTHICMRLCPNWEYPIKIGAAGAQGNTSSNKHDYFGASGLYYKERTGLEEWSGTLYAKPTNANPYPGTYNINPNTNLNSLVLRELKFE